MSEIHRDMASLYKGIDSSCFATFCPETELAIPLAAGSSKVSQIV
jgi:hypothetical protein